MDPSSCKPFDRKRAGMSLGEGAGILILEDLDEAEKRAAKILAEFLGYGIGGEAYHITAPDPDGSGAALAMKVALKDAKLNPEEVTYINAHGTSTKLNDRIESLAIKLALGNYAKKVMVSSTKSMTGHLLGAAGGVEFIACCLSIKDDVIHPT
jgi:3-oxoacyl-[acyl-carrier-protein] synthase II